MVMVLNYLHWLIGILALFIMWRAFKLTGWKGSALAYLSGALVGVAFLLPVVLASYGQKGSVERLPVPVFEPVPDVQMQDRLRRPALNAEQQTEHFNKLVDWRAAKEERNASKTVEVPADTKKE